MPPTTVYKIVPEHGVVALMKIIAESVMTSQPMTVYKIVLEYGAVQLILTIVEHVMTMLQMTVCLAKN